MELRLALARCSLLRAAISSSQPGSLALAAYQAAFLLLSFVLKARLLWYFATYHFARDLSFLYGMTQIAHHASAFALFAGTAYTLRTMLGVVCPI